MKKGAKIYLSFVKKNFNKGNEVLMEGKQFDN